MTTRNRLIADILRIKNDLRSHEAALSAFDDYLVHPAPEPEPEPASDRFSGIKPILAIRQVLARYGKPISQMHLIRCLLENGAGIGKKRGHTNIQISIEINLKNGNLTLTHGLIGLPSWTTKTYTPEIDYATQPLS